MLEIKAEQAQKWFEQSILAKQNDLFQDLLESVKQAGEIKRGELESARVTITKHPEVPDTLSIRESMALSRSQFAHLLGVPVRTVVSAGNIKLAL